MWAQLATAAIGIWLMAAPAVLGYSGPAEDTAHVLGPIIATFALVAAWEATRGVRWVNVVAGGVLAVVSLALGYEARAAVNGVIAGVVVAGLSLVPHERRRRIGGGWGALFGSSDSSPRVAGRPARPR
ncbi:MAG TPA: hypothetical protein VKY73_14185 [Polyangiaceae bacterium]|nr:hypothetical protein [Polyangiaceae bacterium]